MSEKCSDIEPPSKKARLDSEQNDPKEIGTEGFMDYSEDPKTAEENEQNDPKEIGTEGFMDYSEDPKTAEENDFHLDDEKYQNFIPAEEMEKLREFQVLDEVKSNDEDSGDEDSASSDGKSEGLPDEEIEKMLEEDLPEDFKGAPKPKEKTYIKRQKTVLEEKGLNKFEVLPLDWIAVRHCSGVPVYMHRGTRVCTLAKPYFIGKLNTRRHEIPLSAIPCLAYRKALDEEAKQMEINKQIEEQIKNGTWANKINQSKQNPMITNNVNIISNQCPIRENKELNEHGDENITNDSCTSSSIEKNNEIDTSSKVIEENSSEITINLENDSANTNSATVVQLNRDNDDSIDESNTTEPLKCPFSHTVDDKADIVADKDNEKEKDNADESAKEACALSNPSIEGNATSDRVPEENNEGTNKEADANVEIPISRQPVVLPGGIVMPPPRVETVNAQHLAHDQVTDYCRKLFKFKTVNVMHFKRWADRRKYTKARKTLQYPTLPEGTKLITIPAQPNGTDNGGKASRRDWVMNMNGRSYLSVFHEYVCRALQKQPVYEFKQLENASHPYQATVYIGGMQYGVGQGSSKRQAKSAAARASIHILIPEMRDQLDAERPPQPDAEPDFSFFEHVGISDPRVPEFCATTCEPSPHAILRTCLLRNFGAGDKHIHTEMKKLEYQKIELTMKVGKHSATVVCKNKKQAKQRASQAILQALHPHVHSWGSLLRLYGSRSVKSCKERKLEEQQITLLQDQARRHEPNRAVLDKLRREMRKLAERDAAVVPIGTLTVACDAHLPTHSGSNLTNVDL